MSERYDIYYAGKIIEGFDEATVRDNVGTLFKANAATLEKLFSGKPQVVKRGVDKPTALKYKKALEKAGAVPVIRAVQEAQEAVATAPVDDSELPSSSAISSSNAAPKQEAKPAESTGTLADRLAALAGEPSEENVTPQWKAPAAEAEPTDYDLSLAPVGSSVLRESEREVAEELDIDTSAIELSAAEDDSPLEAPAPPPPPAPDISHLTMGEVGEEIPHVEVAVAEVDPDTSHLSMGEVGEEIPHLEVPVELLDPDTSDIELAPEGSVVLEEQYRRRETAVAPNTDHIALA